MQTILKLLSAIVAVAFLLLAAAFFFAPDRIAPRFAILAADHSGYATFRADLAALFLVLAIFTVAGMFRRQWLLVPIAGLAAIVVGRAFSLLIDGRSASNVESLLLELTMLVILAAASSVPDENGRARKILFAFVALFAILIGVAFAFQRPLGIALAKRNVESGMSLDIVGSLPDGLHVGVCGSGSPLPDPARSGPCIFVIAAGHVYLVDSGDGAARRIGSMQIPPALVDGIFLTHFHSDHIGGLGEMMLQRWAGGSHATPLDVYGPEGVESVVDGFNAA